MNTKGIIIGDAPILRERSKEVTKVDKRIRRIIDRLKSVLKTSRGVGISAVQIGKLVRVAIVNDRRKAQYVLINPVITYQEGSSVDEESCLSKPHIYGDVERPTKIIVSYMDDHMTVQDLEATGLLARCIQHEIDHMDGILFTDKAKSIRVED